MSPWIGSRPSAAGAALAALLVLAFLCAPAAGAPAPTQTRSDSIEISGATLLEYSDATGRWTAEGSPVAVTRGQTRLTAPRIVYEQRAGTITASGGAALSEPGLSVRADEARLRLSDDTVRARGGVRVISSRDGPPIELAAAEVEGMLRARRFAAGGAVSLSRGEWRLSGERLDYDDAARVARVTGGPTAGFGEAVMTADAITLYVAEEVARGEGAVRLRRGELLGTARRIDIVLREGRAVLMGNARVERGADQVSAEEIEVALDGSRVSARGGSRLILTPP